MSLRMQNLVPVQGIAAERVVPSSLGGQLFLGLEEGYGRGFKRNQGWRNLFACDILSVLGLLCKTSVMVEGSAVSEYVRFRNPAWLSGGQGSPSRLEDSYIEGL